MNKYIAVILSLLIFTSAHAGMIKDDKSKEMKDKFNETVASMKMEDIIKSMTSDKAACQMTWNTPSDTMHMFCWWKGNSEEDIINQLGQMNDFFEPHKFTECTDQVMDYNAK